MGNILSRAGRGGSKRAQWTSGRGMKLIDKFVFVLADLSEVKIFELNSVLTLKFVWAFVCFNFCLF